MLSLKRTLPLIFIFATNLAFARFEPVRKENLLLWLPMTEAQGTELRDQSSYHSTGTLVGAVAWVKDPGGYAANFGTSPWVSTIDGAVYLTQTAGVRLEVGGANSNRFNFNAADFSIGWEVSIEALVNQMLFFKYLGGVGAGCGAQSGWGLVMLNNGRTLNMANCFDAGNYASSSVYPDARVHFWGISRSGTTLEFYIDGTPIGTATMIGNFGDAGTQALIIGDADGSVGVGEVIGKYGSIAIWNRRITPDEWKAMSAGETPSRGPQ